jgi:hypothetical protein
MYIFFCIVCICTQIVYSDQSKYYKYVYHPEHVTFVSEVDGLYCIGLISSGYDDKHLTIWHQ